MDGNEQQTMLSVETADERALAASPVPHPGGSGESAAKRSENALSDVPEHTRLQA